jgi:hypothetical protein
MNRRGIELTEDIAARQHGVFTDRQASAHAVTRQVLWWHSQPGGRWRHVARNVYELADDPGDWRRPLMAAALALGPEAVLSHRSAAALLGLDGIDRGVVEVTIADGRTEPGWHLHRRDALPPAMFTSGIPHTFPLRTVRDLCLVVDDDHLEMAMESALRLGLISLRELGDIAREPRWKGVQRLRRLLAQRPPGAPPTRSELETRFLQLVRPLPVPDPVRGYKVVHHGEVIAELDVAFPEARLFVETDGGTHEQLHALRRDRQRQNQIVAVLGWRPLRFTWRDVVRQPTTTRRLFMAAYSMAVAV